MYTLGIISIYKSDIFFLENIFFNFLGVMSRNLIFKGMTAAHFYAEYNSVDKMKSLEGTSKLFAKDNIGQTPITYAIIFNSTEALEFLMENGGKNVVNDFDRNQNNPLFYAIKNGNLKYIKILLDNGADVNIQNKRGVSALHYLATSTTISGNLFLEILELLLCYGADINLKDDSSKTFFDYIYNDLVRERIRELSYEIMDRNIKEPM